MSGPYPVRTHFLFKVSKDGSRFLTLILECKQLRLRELERSQGLTKQTTRTGVGSDAVEGQREAMRVFSLLSGGSFSSAR